MFGIIFARSRIVYLASLSGLFRIALRPANFLHVTCLDGRSSCPSCWYFVLEHSHLLPLLALYHLFPQLFSDRAVIYAMLLIENCFLCRFIGKYFYFVAGEMQI
jgi:hypothetical protein